METSAKITALVLKVLEHEIWLHHFNPRALKSSPQSR
jgi:hypothetical protein